MMTEMTAADLVKLAKQGTNQVIAKANPGKELIGKQYTAAFARTFPVFLFRLVDNMAAQFGAKRGAEIRRAVVAYLAAENF